MRETIRAHQATRVELVGAGERDPIVLEGGIDIFAEVFPVRTSWTEWGD
jgi:hypothetical protein